MTNQYYRICQSLQGERAKFRRADVIEQIGRGVVARCRREHALATGDVTAWFFGDRCPAVPLDRMQHGNDQRLASSSCALPSDRQLTDRVLCGTSGDAPDTTADKVEDLGQKSGQPVRATRAASKFGYPQTDKRDLAEGFTHDASSQPHRPAVFFVDRRCTHPLRQEQLAFVNASSVSKKKESRRHIRTSRRGQGQRLRRQALQGGGAANRTPTAAGAGGAGDNLRAGMA